MNCLDIAIEQSASTHDQSFCYGTALNYFDKYVNRRLVQLLRLQTIDHSYAVILVLLIGVWLKDLKVAPRINGHSFEMLRAPISVLPSECLAHVIADVNISRDRRVKNWFYRSVNVFDQLARILFKYITYIFIPVFIVFSPIMNVDEVRTIRIEEVHHRIKLVLSNLIDWQPHIGRGSRIKARDNFLFIAMPQAFKKIDY